MATETALAAQYMGTVYEQTASNTPKKCRRSFHGSSSNDDDDVSDDEVGKLREALIVDLQNIGVLAAFMCALASQVYVGVPEEQPRWEDGRCHSQGFIDAQAPPPPSPSLHAPKAQACMRTRTCERIHAK